MAADLFDLLYDGFVVTDLLGSILHVNNAAATFFRSEKSVLIGRYLPDLFPAGRRDDLRAFIRGDKSDGVKRFGAAVREGALHDDLPIAIAVERADSIGELHWLLIPLAPYHSASQGSRPDAVHSVVDMVKQAHSLQQRFVADASHDLRTPLTIVRAEIDLLRRQPEHDEKTRNAIERIYQESNRLDRLTSNLLLLATLDTNIPETHRVVILDELLLDCINEMNIAVAAKEIAWNIQLSDPVKISCNERALRSALNNVLDNAVKFSPEKGIIHIQVRADGGWVTIEISDEGVGISRSDLSHVFDRFYRADYARSAPGSGLGLPIVKSVVEAHGGSVTIQSETGEGTTLVIKLPS